MEKFVVLIICMVITFLWLLAGEAGISREGNLEVYK